MTHDLVIKGGGPGGYTAALRAAGLGAIHAHPAYAEGFMQCADAALGQQPHEQ